MVRGEHRYTHDISRNDWIGMSTIWTAWLYRKVLPEVTCDNVFRKTTMKSAFSMGPIEFSRGLVLVTSRFSINRSHLRPPVGDVTLFG